MNRKGNPSSASRLFRHPIVRDLLIVLAFCGFTALVTWPYVTRLRDAVVDPGDPYLVSWIIWWDFYQTFHHPLQLFHANTFFPLRYTLAFSEHCYGVALPFFPLFALGFRPLTVQSVAMFFGFAFCGYGAFRLAKTLTESTGAAWVAGIAFAFVPFRFTLMSQLMYLSAGWLPLVFEALVLFVRRRSWKRAIWLGVAFFMSGLSCVSYFTFSLLPLVIVSMVLLTRYQLWRDRSFWQRGSVAIAAASVALMPFMLPYYLVSKLYGFKRSIDEVKANSASPIDWFSAEYRNKLWNGMGEGVTEGTRSKLFPGLLTLVFSLVALITGGRVGGSSEQHAASGSPSRTDLRKRWLLRLDVAAICFFAISIPAIGFENTKYFGGIFQNVTWKIVLSLLLITLIVRCCIAYTPPLRKRSANLIRTLRSDRRSDAFWVGSVLALIGFFYSLGWNSFLYRICYDLLPIFRSIRVPPRSAMIAYVGLAVLAAEGVRRLMEILVERRSPLARPVVGYTVVCVLLLAELNAAPLSFIRGAVYPDAVTLRLKQTSMRGGIVVLPAGADYNHSYMLRAADHQKPLIVGTSGFNSHYEGRIEQLTQTGLIDTELLSLFESIPASYVVVKNNLINAERKLDYEVFLRHASNAGRLTFINRFDNQDDLYAVTKIEPEARPEAAAPISVRTLDWDNLIQQDTTNLMGYQTAWSQMLCRLHVVALGSLPRYAEFVAEARQIGKGLVSGRDGDQELFSDRLRMYAEAIVQRGNFKANYDQMDDVHFIQRLYANAGVQIDPGEATALLGNGAESRAAMLLKVATDPRVAEQHNYEALLLLHYFGYLQRNPDEGPDNNLAGFNFWLNSVDAKRNPRLLTAAFKESFEYKNKVSKER